MTTMVAQKLRPNRAVILETANRESRGRNDRRKVDIYNNDKLSKVTLDEQRGILQMLEAGFSLDRVSRFFGCHLAVVKMLAERRIVAARGLREPKRCECGALIDTEVCYKCELVGVLESRKART